MRFVVGGRGVVRERLKAGCEKVAVASSRSNGLSVVTVGQTDLFDRLEVGPHGSVIAIVSGSTAAGSHSHDTPLIAWSGLERLTTFTRSN